MVEKIFRIGLCFFFLSALLSACGEVSTAIPTAQISPCTPGKNDYDAPIEQRLVDIYEKAVVAIDSENTTNGYNEFRRQAFVELVNSVFDWSDTVDVKLGEKTVRITVTYISPELTQIILINHYLHKAKLDYIDKLEAQIYGDISGIHARDEHVFFITVIASNYSSDSSLRITFPIKKLELTNTENLTIRPEHEDHNLEKTYTLTNGPVYGFFYYPMAVSINEGNCMTVLDKNRDTRIVLSISNFIINEKDYGTYSWEYNYAPLIKIASDSDVQNYKFPLTSVVDEFSPIMSKMRPTSLEEPEFWIALARLIWLETTQDP